MLGRLLGMSSGPKYDTDGSADQLTPVPDPPALGALYFSKTGSDGALQQTCMYTFCEVVVRPTATRFKFELAISRSEQEEPDNEESDFPLDVVFPIEKSSNFFCDGERFGWSDRSGKRFNLDLDSDVSPDELRKAIASALYQNIHSALPGADDEAELEDLLKVQEDPVDDERIIAKGELMRVSAEMFKFDLDKNVFVPMCPLVTVTINSAVVKDDNSRAYLMLVYDTASGERIMESEISNALNAQFFSQSLSLVWLMSLTPAEETTNPPDGEFDPETSMCLSIKLPEAEDFVKLRNQYSVCLYEVNHQASIEDMKLKDGDIAFIEDSARDDVDLMDVDEEDPEEEEEERHVRDANPTVGGTMVEEDDGMHNSHLAIAANHDRTFVVRGNKMGVFETGDEGAAFKTTVQFKNPDTGKSFTPSKVLLHQMDRSMLLLDPEDESRIMRMDLERGEVVDSWAGGLTANTPVKTVHKSSKYSNLTDQQDFVGVNKNQLLRMDPRTNEFVVQSKKYAASTRARLDCVATTGAGYLAVASETGDIRLFDQIGKNAKTHLPGISGAIVGIDVTEDGFFVLVTTPKYLLIIDTRVKGREKGGFMQSMGKHKPAPRKLTIRSEDIVKHRMGELNFTTAHFNTGSTLERSIVTSTGPFIVVWNFRQVKMGRLDCYTIKRYSDNVVADDFTFNNDGRIVVTMPNDVSVARR